MGTQRDAVMGQQFNVDQAAFGMESAKASIDTVAAMKSAGQQIKQTMKTNLNINDVDEADLDAELDLLEDEFEEEEEVGNTAESTPSYLLPTQPVNTPESKISTQVDQYGLPVQAA